MSQEKDKKIEVAEYKAKLLQAELTAVTSSKAYKISKVVGGIKNQIKSDPVGLTKKAARILLNEPKKFTHLVRSGKRSAFIAQSAIEQTNKYQEWILLNEPTEKELDEQRKESEKFTYKPLISIVTPIYNPPTEVLEDLLDSVLDQTYPHFELCLWDDYGKNEDVIALLKKHAKEDDRIKFFQFIDNQGIAGASNRILKKAKGDYIALLDHDDTLSPDALFENVKKLNEKPYDLIYSDKDKIDIDGNRFDPLFKPQYSPEMMLNVNYLTHLNVMRTELVKKIGGWDTTTNGAQDWDLFLRVVGAAKEVGHIPKILYHWRVIESSTALSIETKPYALAGQRKAIDNYLSAEKIPAKSYHEKTELFLKWNDSAIDQSPFVFIRYTSLPNTLRMMRFVRKATKTPAFIILVEEKVPSHQQQTIASRTKSDVLTYTTESLAEVLGNYCTKKVNKKRKEATVVIIQDFIRFPKKNNWYENLTGWLAINKVNAVSGRLVDRHDLIIDSGGIITSEYEYYPIFYKYPKYYQSYIGNAEWVRNLSAISANYSATTLSQLREYSLLKKSSQGKNSFDDYITWVTETGRVVLSPQSTASIYEDEGINPIRTYVPLKSASKSLKPYYDKYGNPNMSPSDPMRLFADEPLVGINEVSLASVDTYQHDATILANTFDISHEALIANKEITENTAALQNVQSVAWILPSFDAVYAGLMNIFYFAHFLATQKNLKTTVYILKDTSDASSEKKLVVKAFPELKSATFVGIQPDQIDQIKAHDIGIATQWATAYPLAHTNLIKRKCYFIQDNETNFYPKGSISSLVELSYTFGFTAIANTEGLLSLYKDRYSGQGVVLKSVVDLSAYYPRENKYYTPQKPYKVFFYARPNMPRNAFELGIAGLKKLKEELGSDIEIITAGAPWDPRAYGVEGMFTNLGKISYEAVPKLYRSVDAGLMFMFSGHPGVTASELMASGCPVVVNEYDDITWQELYQHEKTCLVTRASASEVARNLRRCLEDEPLRKKIIDGGLKKVKVFYDNYEETQDTVYKAIIKGVSKNEKR